jgi:acyl dehydratase
MKFAEFHPGLVLRHGPASLSEDEIVRFAKEWDPQWFHTDPEAAAAGFHRGLIASGWQTCALAMRMACECALTGSESFASPGVEYIKWLQPVQPDKPLYFQAEVLEVRRSASKPALGVLRWRWQLQLDDGSAVMEMTATSLFNLPLPEVGGPAP